LYLSSLASRTSLILGTGPGATVDGIRFFGFRFVFGSADMFPPAPFSGLLSNPHSFAILLKDLEDEEIKIEM